MVLEQPPRFGVHLLLLLWHNCAANVGGAAPLNISCDAFFTDYPDCLPTGEYFRKSMVEFSDRQLTAILSKSTSVKFWCGENTKLDGGSFDKLLSRNSYE